MDRDGRFLPQTVDYLGFLEARLRDLQGIATLVYELVQNADDTRDEHGQPGARRITFDVQDDALLVANDGRFRSEDFARLQHVAGGGKRAEADTTGAFGLGFIVVYQVTDAPEIFSAGRHWTIRPDAPVEQRIVERTADTNGTLFRLPYAFQLSPVRRALRLNTISPAQLDDITAEIASAIRLAAIFLRQLETLEVRRNGTLVQRIERKRSESSENGEQLHLRTNGDEIIWRLFSGNFAATAEALRQEHNWQIESHRSSRVTLALPNKPLSSGRLFATLPSQSTTSLPFHLNADFFPTSDRKRILLEHDYQSEWNRSAIRCAAHTLATHFDDLPALLAPVGLWQLLAQLDETRRRAEAGQLDPVFAAFWQAVAPLLANKQIIFTTTETWVSPRAARLITSPAEMKATSILEALDIPLVHADLRSYAALMQQPEIGVPLLRVTDITAALQVIPNRTPLDLAPPPLNDMAAWQVLWRALDTLLRRAPSLAERNQDVAALLACSLTLMEGEVLCRAEQVAKGNEETRRVFSEVQWLHPAVNPDTLPGSLVHEFDAQRAVTYLSEYTKGEMEEIWRYGRLDPIALYHWFESRQWEILGNQALIRQLRRLPIFPVFDQLLPLTLLYMPGGFDDPLKLSGLVDVAALSGRTDFLQDLGVRQLTFKRYLETEVPRILTQHPDLRSDARHQLVQLIASRLGEIRDDDSLREKLRPLPLVACLDGHFRPAAEVYIDRRVMAVLGDRAHVAEPASRAIQALYKWLGVAMEPRPADVIQMMLALSEQNARQPLDEPMRAATQRAWQVLSQALTTGQIRPEALTPLHERVAVPNARHVLARPDALFLVDDPMLAARFPTEWQDNFLPPQADTQTALLAVGVRRLSQAAQTQLVTTADSIPDPVLAQRLNERRSLLERVIAAEGGEKEVTPTVFDQIHFARVPHLRIHYALTLPDKTIHSQPEAVPAVLLGNTLYYTNEEEALPWATIGRLLAGRVKQGGPIGGLAAGIKEVLAASTAAEAGRVLNELGYP